MMYTVTGYIYEKKKKSYFVVCAVDYNIACIFHFIEAVVIVWDRGWLHFIKNKMLI